MNLTFEFSANAGPVYAKHTLIHAESGVICLVEADETGVRYARKWNPETGEVDWSTPAFTPRSRVRSARAVREYRKIGSLGMFGVLY